MIKLTSPVDPEQIKNLRAGDTVEISGVIFTGRDAGHKRLCQLLSQNQPLPIDINNGIMYYVGPTPTKPGMVIGSAGPTSSYRMDSYSEPLMQQGLKVMIGKGSRSKEYKEMLKKYGGVYLSAIGGTAVSISKTVKKCQVVCYEDLGAEAIHRLEVDNFFAIITYDSVGNDLFEQGIEKYKKI